MGISPRFEPSNLYHKSVGSQSNTSAHSNHPTWACFQDFVGPILCHIYNHKIKTICWGGWGLANLSMSIYNSISKEWNSLGEGKNFPPRSREDSQPLKSLTPSSENIGKRKLDKTLKYIWQVWKDQNDTKDECSCERRRKIKKVHRCSRLLKETNERLVVPNVFLSATSQTQSWHSFILILPEKPRSAQH